MLVGSLTSQYQLADAVTHVWKLFRYWSWCCKCIFLLHEMFHLAAFIHATLYNNTDNHHYAFGYFTDYTFEL